MATSNEAFTFAAHKSPALILIKAARLSLVIMVGAISQRSRRADVRHRLERRPRNRAMGPSSQGRKTMPKSLTREIKHDVQDRLEDVASTLLTAADNLSEDAEDAVAKAAKVLREAAADLAKRAPAAAKSLARQAADEAKAHPVATAAAALSAAAALIALLGVARKKSS